MPTYHLGTRSLAELEGVHPDLVKVVKRAIEITPIDFAVTDGKRTIEEQRAFVASGASQTMDSRHLTGHAVDLVAFVGNKGRWELDLLCKIALAMRSAALELKVPLRWGGNWDVQLTDVDTSPEDLVQDYIEKRIAAGRKPFVDAPHFELPKSSYPAQQP
ncbi:MAG: M15 family metallopeptidase [Burkholderiales bacterium]|nr:M15 family metallopeptidase [Burkholderiales bacterium]